VSDWYTLHWDLAVTYPMMKEETTLARLDSEEEAVAHLWLTAADSCRDGAHERTQNEMEHSMSRWSKL
jgi:hypothetical protein